ncbi:MAG: SDR family oxidoreductase [Candidatus Scalinduaceae bacterium]
MQFSTKRNFADQMKIPDSWRILVTGITSIHGWPIFTQLRELLPKSRLFGIRPPDSNIPNADNVSPTCITNQAKLEKIRDAFKPTHVVHCAGVCDLDACEGRPEWAYSINVQGTKTVVDTFGSDVPILYMSSDLVFSGNNSPAGGYTEDDQPNPISVAGKTFARAEKHIQKCKNHCIVRLGLPLGDSVNGDKGAIDWINSRFSRNLPVTLFYDEYRSCINCEDIAEMAVTAMVFELEGLFHFGGDKVWNIYDIGKYVLKIGGHSPDLLNGILRHQEKNGPPRIGNVSLNSNRLRNLVKAKTLFPEPGC